MFSDFPAIRARLLRFCAAAISCLLTCTLSPSCGGGTATAPINSSKDYPPGSPAKAERLQLSSPDEQDPLLWWEENILALIPENTYPDTATAQLAGQFVAETNRLRIAAGLEPVSTMPILNQVAQAHAMDEGIRDYWNHRTPEGLGSRDRVLAAGGGVVRVGGENSAVARPGEVDLYDVVYTLSVHEGHRELFFDPDVRFIGIGIYNHSPAEHVHFIQLLVSF